ncbi:MAG: hypothetical protein IPP34_08125 [Bacteroidetes bacterium]|nr:hypothetical protein [Bacteroidota bacterium]
MAYSWVSTGTGSYTVTCYATNLNGNADQNTGNDVATKELSILTSLVQRTPLFEIFTSSTCPPCFPGNTNFHNIIDTIPQSQHVVIKFRQDFPEAVILTPPMKVWQDVHIMELILFPVRKTMVWDGNSNTFSYQLYSDAREVPAQYMIDGTYSEDTIARTWAATVRYSPLFDALGSILQVGIIEKRTELNVKTNLETEFFNVMKKMLPTEFGTTLQNIPAGTWDSVSVAYTFNGNYRLPPNGQTNLINHAIEHSVEEFSDLAMTAWIESPSNPKQVYQAANLVKTSATGIFTMNQTIDAVTFIQVQQPTSPLWKSH